MRSFMLSLAVCLSIVAFARPAAAQARNEARLIVTVVDQTTAVIPGATVTVVGVDDTTRKTTLPAAKTSDRGVATIEHLPPGRYSVTGEFPGFDLGLLRDIRLKAGDNKHVVVLPLQKMNAEVTVGRDAQLTASDRASTFGTALTREQVDSLSEDPDEMRRQLGELAGPGAAIRVDSFEGQQLPPKAQIKAVHITRDAFAAENHSAGGMWIDIITQPGMGPLRGSTRFSFYNSKLDGQNPLIPKRGPGQNRGVNLTLNGTLKKERSGFSISFYGNNGYTTPNLYLAVPAGQVARNVNLRQPSDSLSAYGTLDYALTKDQTMRVSFNTSGYSQENQGVGAYDLVGRAYTTENRYGAIRIQEAGPIGRRFFINTRLAVNWSKSSSSSALQEPTVIVLDAFTSGGAQRSGGRRMTGFTLASDLDYVRGRSSWRTGIEVNGGQYRSDDFSNYLGTYTFESLDAYEAGRPRSYTQRIGDPLIKYHDIQASFYVQDDIRLRKGLTLSPGLRIEAQSLLTDASNVAPRVGITWSPFKGGKTTLRGSAGIFYDWLNTGTYEQTLRVDGVRQRELNVFNPSYPDPGTGGVIPPTNKYLLAPDLRMPQTARMSAGFDQQITKTIRVGATYARTWGDQLLVGQNLNRPVDGVRPDPAYANVIEAQDDGKSRQQSLSLYTNVSLAGGPGGALAIRMDGPGTTTGKLFSWRRGLNVFGNYGAGKAENNTDGAFSVPATGSLASEWGSSMGDVRQRFNVGVSTGALKNLMASINMNASSGSPYTIRTGYDDNADLIFNDRPAGVGRNTERTAWRWNSYGYFTYTLGIGKRTVALPPGITITSGVGGLSVGTSNQQPAARYRLMFMVAVQNITNHANYSGYSGVMTSPFFKKPTNVDGVRTINMSVGVSF